MDDEWVCFLQWALPHLRMRWAGFRQVRRQVIRRVRRRMDRLGLQDPDAYREYLHHHPAEWDALDGLCRVTVSHFYRDRAVFEALEQKVLPTLTDHARKAGRNTLSLWSCGCASGEEPYTLAILWTLVLAASYPDMKVDILATDADPDLLARAEAARYPGSSLKDLPPAWRKAAFDIDGEHYRLRPRFRQCVRFLRHDVRDRPPDGPFDLILCRNLAFTYYDDALQRSVAEHLHAVLRPNGILVVGGHETIPREMGFKPLAGTPGLYKAA